MLCRRLRVVFECRKACPTLRDISEQYAKERSRVFEVCDRAFFVENKPGFEAFSR